MDDLPLTFILIGLATLVVIFLVAATVLYFWQRHKRRRVHIDKVTIANSFSDGQSAYNKAGSTEFISGTDAKSQQSHRTTLTHVFHGPAVPKKTFIAPSPPKGPSSAADQLSQTTLSTDRAKSPPNDNLRTVVVVGDDDIPPPEPRHATPSPKPRSSLSPGSAQSGAKPKEKSLKIDLPEQNNRLANYKALPKDSPLTVRKFPERMEKLQENENERLYYEFEMLNKSTAPLKPSTVAESHENIRKNRFYDILPFDENRVILQGSRGNYINASYVKDERTGNIRYVAAQGPIGESETIGGRRDATVGDFWRMIWDEDINCVVMLTQCVEGHRQKCAVYWPENAGETVHIDSELTMNLYCITEDDICFQRELWLEKQGHAKRKIVQWHYKEWRDAAGPQDAENLLTFMESIRASEKKYPLLVHCSAGVGRTGVFIALDILLDKLAAESVIDVYETVSRLRETRVNMVQSGEQYVTLYEVIALAIRKRSASRYSG